MATSTRMSLTGLYRWGYSHEDRGIRFLTNVIQVQCGRRYQKMLGLWRLLNGGHEVRPWDSDLFAVAINGERCEISVLEQYSKR